MVRVSPKMPFSSGLSGRGRPSTRTITFIALGAVALIAVLSLLAGPAVTVSANLSGRPFVVDGDTLEFRSTNSRVRIAGIDAPELDQRCRDATGAEWTCGMTALTALRGLVGEGVRCSGNQLDRYGRVLVKCISGTGDVGAAMVLAGMAVASGQYLDEERQARESRIGLWSGEFENPRTFRERSEPFDLMGWISGFFGG